MARHPRALRRVIGIAIAVGLFTGPGLPGLDAPAPASGAARGESAQASAGTRKAAALKWKTCAGVKASCATLRVPLDYAKPKGKTIKLALARHRATKRSQRIGSLLVNPGGPGASGVSAALSAEMLLPKDVLDRFDIVGWDTRGVGGSAPVKCAANLDEVFHLDYSPDSRAEITQMRSVNKRVAESCRRSSGALLRHVSSIETARDMDRIRAALGENKLTYLGFSYGTYLGTLYAELFPGRVRALVLDGAVDPTLSFAQSATQQAIGLDRALGMFLSECSANRSCAFHSGGDALGAYLKLEARVDKKAMDGGNGRKLGPGEFDIAVATPLYGGRPGWVDLSEALALAANGNGAMLMEFFDSYVGRSGRGRHGQYDNSQPAFWAIGCLDLPSPRNASEFSDIAAEAATVAPRFGASTVYLGIICSFWPYPPVGTNAPVTAKGAPPILVVGTLDDPITPASWSRGLASQLESGHLLLTEGEGHSAFGRLNACVDDHVMAYLVSLSLPPEGLVCK